MDIMARLRNKWFIMAMFSFIVLIGNVTGLYTIPVGYESIIETALAILIGLGIIVDPSTPGLKDGVK